MFATNFFVNLQQSIQLDLAESNPNQVLRYFSLVTIVWEYTFLLWHSNEFVMYSINTNKLDVKNDILK